MAPVTRKKVVAKPKAPSKSKAKAGALPRITKNKSKGTITRPKLKPGEPISFSPPTSPVPRRRNPYSLEPDEENASSPLSSEPEAPGNTGSPELRIITRKTPDPPGSDVESTRKSPSPQAPSGEKPSAKTAKTYVPKKVVLTRR